MIESEIWWEEAFLNSFPSKHSLPTTIFSRLEDPLDRKCVWKELGGALYTQKWILNISFL